MLLPVLRPSAVSRFFCSSSYNRCFSYYQWNLQTPLGFALIWSFDLCCLFGVRIGFGWLMNFLVDVWMKVKINGHAGWRGHRTTWNTTESNACRDMRWSIAHLMMVKLHGFLRVGLLIFVKTFHFSMYNYSSESVYGLTQVVPLGNGRFPLILRGFSVARKSFDSLSISWSCPIFFFLAVLYTCRGSIEVISAINRS